MQSVTLDLETSGLDAAKDRIHLVCFGYLDRPVTIRSLEEVKNDPELMAVLADPEATLRGHNVKFDAMFLVANGIPVNCRLEDTRVLAYLNWPNEAYDLKSLTETKLKKPVVRLDNILVKVKKKLMPYFDASPKYFRIGNEYVCVKKLLPYVKDDVVNCDAIFNKADKSAWWNNYEKPLTRILFDMEQRGITLDVARLEELRGEFSANLELLAPSLGGVNPRSNKQLTAKLKADGLDLDKMCEKSKAGGYTLDAIFFKRLGWKGNAFAQAVNKHRKLAINLNTFVEPLIERAKIDGKVHGQFNQAGKEDRYGDGSDGTATGRLTSSEPNLQNIPARTKDGKKVRSCFVASPGFKLFVTDLKQIEPRLVAHYTQAPKLLRAFAEGRDTHGMFASDIFQKPIEKLSPIERFIGKTSWLATVYGCSYKKLLLICEKNSDDPLDLDLGPYLGLFDALDKEAKAKVLRFTPNCNDELYAQWMFFKNVQDQFTRSNPEIMAWRARQISTARFTGYVDTIGGRRIEIHGLNSAKYKDRAAAERHCINYRIQGSAADIMKMILVNFDKDFVKAGDGHLLATVHDEVLGEFKDSLDLDLTLTKIDAIMCDAVKLNNVSIDADTKLIDNWGGK